MQPLKSLTFIRIGHVSSHKYKPNKKLLQSIKTLVKHINKDLQQHNIKTDIVTYYNNNKLFIDFDDEELIDNWVRNNRDLYNEFIESTRLTRFNKDSFHAPPQLRGLYAFPQYRLEPFLTHWDKSKFDIKVFNIDTDDEQCRMRAKNYTIIKYNKPTLWCHFIKEATKLNVALSVKNSWVLVKSKDYLKVLALYEKNRLKSNREDMNGQCTYIIKNPYMFGSKDELEVFLVGV